MSDERDLIGTTVLVTGANAGIGRATADALATRGATLLLHGRDRAKLEAAAAELAPRAGAPITPLVADFARLADVARLAREVKAASPRLDVLVNNAGVIRDRFVRTDDGFEMTFQVNHLAPFLLTMLLLGRLRATPGSRVLTVASGAHGSVKNLELESLAEPRHYRTVDVYARSKACNILFTREFARRHPAEEVEAYAMHPGVVATQFAAEGDVGGPLRWILRAARPLMKTPEQGADTLVWLATTREPPAHGAYCIKRREAQPRAYARDGDNAAQLWALSERLVAPYLDEGTPDERPG